MKILAVINQKGGVGKTACAYNLAYSLALKNQCVTLIDLDPSANATRGFNCTEFRFSSYDLMTTKGSSLDYSIQAYFGNDNLWLIPSSIKLAMAAREIINKPFRETILSKKLKDKKRSNFIIDCPPTLSDLTVNAIYGATDILIPITYEEDAIEGMNDLFSVINEIREDNPINFKIVRNQKDMRKSKTNDYIERHLKDFIINSHVCSTIIRQDENINQAKIERKPVFLYNPQSNGAKDFLTLTGELFNV